MTYENIIIVAQAMWKLFTIWWPLGVAIVLFAFWEKYRENHPS